MVNAMMATKARTYTTNTGQTRGAIAATRGPSAHGVHPERPSDRLSQAILLDLARRRHGGLADDLESLGKLVAGELFGVEIRDQLAERDGLARLRDDERAGALDQARIRHGDDGDVLDLGMGVVHILDFGHRDVLAAPDDEV